MKRLLVTGGSGFLGSRLSLHFLNKYKVIVPSHKEMDLTDYESVSHIFNKDLPDIVVHCGAISDVRTCDEHPTSSYKVNVIGTKNIAKVCERFQSKLIFCSSDQIYFGSDGMQAHREDEKVNPINEYGKQKLEAENICFDYCKDAISLRLSWMYDTLQRNPNEHGDFFRNLVYGIENNQPLSYPIHDYRGITYVHDVLLNMEKVFTLPGGVYNFGSENDRNTHETVKTLFHKLNWNDQMIIENNQAFLENPRNISMNTDNTKKYGIAFPSTIDGLLDCVNRHYLV